MKNILLSQNMAVNRIIQVRERSCEFRINNKFNYIYDIKLHGQSIHIKIISCLSGNPTMIIEKDFFFLYGLNE